MVSHDNGAIYIGGCVKRVEPVLVPCVLNHILANIVNHDIHLASTSSLIVFEFGRVYKVINVADVGTINHHKHMTWYLWVTDHILGNHSSILQGDRNALL